MQIFQLIIFTASCRPRNDRWWQKEGNEECCSDLKGSKCGEGDGDCDSDSECEGSLVCGKDNCPWGDGDDCCMKPPVDCQWSVWQAARGAAGQCDRTCGGGTKKQTRTISQKAQNGGKECHGPSHQTQSCNTNPCPVDCQWSAWQAAGGAAGQCDRTCGGGTKKQTRTISRKAQNGGKQCHGPSHQTQHCNTNPCPGEWG